MPELHFAIESAGPVRTAATPLMGFQIAVTERTAEPTPVHSIILRCQVRIEPARRRYDADEQSLLLDLFGTPDRWGKTLQDLLWANVTTAVPPFSGRTTAEVQVACGPDFALAATKYFDALKVGDIPLLFLFSGTIFYERGEGGGLCVAQIPWDREARFRLPVATWKALMNAYYPNTAWLGLRKDVFDRLHRFKRHRGLPTWEQAVEQLLASAEVSAP